MAMNTVYRKISDLTGRLNKEGNVTKRRELCKELKEVLSEPRNREMLLDEATQTGDGKKALSSVWSMILNATTLAAEQNIPKSSKKAYRNEDLVIPKQMLLRLNEFSTFANMDSLLPCNEVRKILQYCLELLANDKAKAVAEQDLLQMLVHMCSQPDFVTHFRLNREMSEILAELQVRLDAPGNVTMFEHAAKAFAALMRTAKSLGIGMHILMPRCLEMVEDWCQRRLRAGINNATDIPGLEHMYGAASALLSSHPEQAIYDLAMNGRSLFKLARRYYPHARDKQKRGALVEYFLSHLLVCQTAGKLQGLLPGDCGDVGKVSLDDSQVGHLLAIIATETDIERSMVGNDSTTAHNRASRTPSSSRAQSMEPTELSRRHLELCARLLSLAQRHHLSRAEWDAWPNPVEAYLRAIPPEADPDESFEDLPLLDPSKSWAREEFLRSPWMNKVGLPLWSYCNNALSREASQSHDTSSQGSVGVSPHGVCKLPPQSDIEYFGPLLKSMSDMMHDKSKSPVTFLQLVCACAETFPLGQCWASNTQQYWHSFTPNDCLTEEKAYCNGCSPDDIALVVSLVTNILEPCGRADGSEQTQRWVLTCLIRLAESSELVASAAEWKGESSSVLHLVWRRAWNTLLDPDLRYVSYTRDSSRNSIGELVLVLLTEMTQRRCTDSPTQRNGGSGTTAQMPIGEFVHANQNRIWSLDVFSNADSIAVCAVFDLVGAVLHHAGLSEEGRDVIDGSGPKKLMSHGPQLWERVPTYSRRYRLVALCLRFLESNVFDSATDNCRDCSESVCGCLIALIEGKTMPCLTTFDKEGSLGVELPGSFRENFFVTNMSVGRHSRRNFDGSPANFISFFKSLWTDYSSSVSRSWFPECDSSSTEIDESEMAIARELLSANRRHRDKHHCDFVAPAASSVFQKFVADVIIKLTPPSSVVINQNYQFEESTMGDQFEESVMGDQVSNGSVSSMARRTSVLKVFMSVALSSTHDSAFKEVDMKVIEGSLVSTLDEIVAQFPLAEQDDGRCVTVMTDLLQILRALSVVSLSIDACTIPKTVTTRLDEVFGMCRRLLFVYSESRGASAVLPAARRESTVDDDDDIMTDAWDQKDKAEEWNESIASDDGISSHGRKRRRSTNSWGQTGKRCKDLDRVAPPKCPSSLCARRIASMMVFHLPSYGVCKMVAEAIALVRSDDPDGRGNQSSSSVCDLDAALHCLHLFCSSLVLHRSQDMDAEPMDEQYDDEVDFNKSGSTVSLCCDIIQEVRAAASATSKHCLFGYEVCADLVHQREVKGCRPLDTNECTSIIDILLSSECEERKLLKARPNLRTRRLTATISVFRDAKERMHRHLDGHFKNDFIAPGLDDLSASVRREAARAVAAALRCFTQQAAIINGIVPNLPPLPSRDSDNEGILLRYQRWYDDKSLGLRSESADEERLVWDCALYTFQSFSILAKGLIAGSTSMVDSFRKLLFEIVLLASERPDLEALCYHACEKAAGLARFGTVRELLLSECEYIFDQWLDIGKKLKDMPLLLTAPTVLFQLLRDGLAPFLLGDGAIVLSSKRSDRQRVDDRSAQLLQLRELSAKDYVERSCHFVLPIICISNATKRAIEDEVALRYLAEVSDILTRANDGSETSVKSLILGHLPDVLAFVEPFLYSVVEKNRRFGGRVVKYMKGIVTESDYESTRRKRASIVVRQLLRQWGKGCHYFENGHLDSEVACEAIRALDNGDGRHRSKLPFETVGSSITEQVLHARFWLSQSILPRQQRMRWSAINMVFSCVLEYMRDEAIRDTAKAQVGFCISTIIDILTNASLSVIYPDALETLCALLDEISKLEPDSKASTVATVFYRLVGTLVTTHGRFQDTLIEECLSSWVNEQCLMHCSSGLRLSTRSTKRGGDVWGWDSKGGSTEKADRIETVLAKDPAKIDKLLYNTLTRTYDALELLLGSSSSLEGVLSLPLPLESLISFASEQSASYALYETLSVRNPKFSARKLVAKFLEQLGSKRESAMVTAEEAASKFLEVSTSLTESRLGQCLFSQEPKPATMDVAAASSFVVKTSLSPDFLLLLDELTFMRATLERSEQSQMEVGSRVDIKIENRYCLVTALLKLCEASYPEAIRAAASRCLGAMGPCDVESVASFELELSGNEGTLFQSLLGERTLEDGELLKRIKCSCLESLARYLLSPRPKTAIAALEAIKAILASKEGRKCQDSIKDPKCTMLLDPLARANKRSKSHFDDFVVSDQYLDSMIARAAAGDVEISAKDDLNWCWHKTLWMSNKSGALGFEDWVRFLTCAMISCCFVDAEQVPLDRVSGSSLFFRYFIKLCALEHELASKVFPGIILDLLRDEIGRPSTGNGADTPGSLASQHLSRCFGSLIESTAGVDGRAFDKQPQSLSLAMETIDIIRVAVQKTFEKHTKDDRGMKRRSIPIGIRLRLNGLHVARACVQANRFASAIFYADMLSDKCYGGAGRILERLANGEVTGNTQELDISGFDTSEAMDPDTEGEVDSKLSLLSILQESFTSLGDLDAADAVNIENAALNFFDDGFQWISSNFNQSDALARLKALDLRCQGQHGRVIAGQHVMDCLEEVGLDDVLRTYTSGFVANKEESSPSALPEEKASLRDRWFKGKLKSIQWGGETVNSSFAQEPSQIKMGTTGTLIRGMGFYEGVCKALLSFIKHDIASFLQNISQTRDRLIDDLSRANGGDAKLRGIVCIIERLQFLNDIEGLSNEGSCVELALKWKSQNERTTGNNVVESPIKSIEIPLRLTESVLWVRESALRAFQAKKPSPDAREGLQDCVVNHLWQVGSVSRLVGRSDNADAVVRRLHSELHLKHVSGLPENVLVRLRFEEAMIMESQGNFSNAIRGLQRICKHFAKALQSVHPAGSDALYADALLVCGEWMSRYKVEAGDVIMVKYLEKASELADGVNPNRAYPDPDSCHHARRSFSAHLALAKLASGLFERACTVIESPEWRKAGSNIEATEQEIKICNEMIKELTDTGKRKQRKRKSGTLNESPEETKSKISDLVGVVRMKENDLIVTKEKRRKTEESIPRWLRLAVTSYTTALSCAGLSESLDVAPHVYRLLSLWFANCDQTDRAEVVDEVMSETLPRVPSFRFVPMTYQISSRLASGPEGFQTTLEKLLHRMSIEHPYHCIVQLISLSNGANIGDGQYSNQYKDNIDTAKVKAANDLVNKLAGDDSYVAGLVDSTRAIADAYIRLALFDIVSYRKNHSQLKERGPMNVSAANAKSSERLEKVLGEKNLRQFKHRPCIFTKPPALDPGGQYGDGLSDPRGSERIKRFDMTFTCAESGASKPKIVTCYGDSGQEYKQIVKGNDDVRGDAIMQQVFRFVNDLMRRRSKSSSTRITRELKIITYNIVPLSPVCGVLEFLKDSIPFLSYLFSAHRRYANADELSMDDAYEKFRSVKGASVEKKREVFDEICKGLPPAFRHFFTERFGHSAPLWYASKVRYTRSCAVNSIVGHMLGIGDRHGNNIFINQKTGEVAHIDFGIVFEQAQLCPVPETVPFRLTRDFVDGMGPTGIEGTFTRAAEETAVVLRENSNALLTILSAVVSDPLYKWNLTPREARRRQRYDGDDEETNGGVTGTKKEETIHGAERNDDSRDGKANESALRALARIEEKLQGYEDGTTGQRQSVEGQVQLLIHSARDADNLCRMFYGWQPHL